MSLNYTDEQVEYLKNKLSEVINTNIKLAKENKGLTKKNQRLIQSIRKYKERLVRK